MNGRPSSWPTSCTGTIAGYYYDASDVTHGFVRAADGKIKTFDPTGSVDTMVQSINNNGVVTISGLATEVTIVDFDATDRLVINGLGGQTNNEPLTLVTNWTAELRK